MDGYAPIWFDELNEIDHDSKEVIVFRNEERIVTRKYRKTYFRKEWGSTVSVYHKDNPPVHGIKPEALGLDKEPASFNEINDIVKWPEGEELLKLALEEMGDHGLVGVFCGTTLLLHNQEEIVDYYEDPGKYRERRDCLMEYYEKRFNKLMSLNTRPDFICTGGSGSLIFQNPDIFRELALPIVKKITKLCKENGIYSHVHSCGPEYELVKILALETDLDIIDPLEIPPMGDCDLAKIKSEFGNKLILKGNLHTTNIMLNGTVEMVKQACEKAIDDAGDGGGFILSTGDQCGRDTPHENIFAMVESARNYGKYI
jgi:uroporphyrinogen decarboxylase